MRRVIATVALVGLVLCGCGDGPSEQEKLADDLESDYDWSREQATCVADQVYERFSEDDIDALRAAESIDDLPDDLRDAVRAALTPCASAGS